MSYVGNSPVTGPAHILEGSGTGDGSTVAFAMGFTPGSEQEVLVFIDGHKQDTTAYSISGTTCTFTAAPFNGENIDFIGYEVGKSVVPQDNSVDQSKINTGSLTPIVQIQTTQDGEVATGTATIPADDTIPQNTEGTEFLTVTITPTSTTNKLIINAELSLAHDSTVSNMAIALFQDSITDAIAAMRGAKNASTNHVAQLSIRHEMLAGTVNPITFKIRAGCGVAGTTTFNGNSAVRLFGGVMASYITVTEVMQ